jgi:predicted porin
VAHETARHPPVGVCTAGRRRGAANLVSYYLPPLGGIYAQFSLAAGENAAGKKYCGGRVGYAAGPLNSGNTSGLTAAKVSTEANDGKQLAIGYVYDLSKRTALYTTYARIDNKGSASFAVATPPALPAGRDSSGYEFGLRHRF